MRRVDNFSGAGVKSGAAVTKAPAAGETATGTPKPTATATSATTPPAPGSREAAIAAATAYVATVKGPPLGGLSLRPGTGTPIAGRPTTVAWQKKEGDAWLPSGVVVQVSRGDRVVGYQWIDTKVTVSTTPTVTAAAAAVTARKALKLGKVLRVASQLEVLDIGSDQDGKVTQHLVWIQSLYQKGVSGSPAAMAIVDALSGEVLKAAKLTP